MNNIFSFLCNYDGKVVIDGKDATHDQINAIDIFNVDRLDIKLIPKNKMVPNKYKIKVKNWMAYSGNLDFHQRWNDGISMPTTEILCEIIGETPGMYRVDGKCSNGESWKGYISKAAIINIEKEETWITNI